MSDKKDESVEKGNETPPPENAEAAPEVVEIPPRSIGARIRDIEKRWGKDFEQVLIDLHDHVFGRSPEHNESDDPVLPKAE